MGTRLGKDKGLLAVVEVGDLDDHVVIIPLGESAYLLNILVEHHHMEDRVVLLNLRLLIPDSIEQVLLVVFVFHLDVPQLSKATQILLLDFLEPLPHGLHLVCEVMVLTLYVQEVLFSPPFVFGVLLLLLFLGLEFLTQLIYLLQFPCGSGTGRIGCQLLEFFQLLHHLQPLLLLDVQHRLLLLELLLQLAGVLLVLPGGADVF